VSSSPGAGAIYLTGFMGSGKSMIGRELALRLHRPFIDLDDLIARREGHSIDHIFSALGEPAFREAEHRALMALPLEEGPVVATGGGVVLKQENRSFMARTGLRVWLKCPLAEIIRRLESAAGEPGRPLWTGDRQELARLLEERIPVYAEAAELTVDSSVAAGETVGEILRRVEERGA
jgi:shikimate kinase